MTTGHVLAALLTALTLIIAAWIILVLAQALALTMLAVGRALARLLTYGKVLAMRVLAASRARG